MAAAATAVQPPVFPIALDAPISLGGNGNALPTAVSMVNVKGSPDDHAKASKPAAATTWSDMDLSRYLVYGSGFVFLVDSLMYPFEVLRTRMQADNITHQRGIVSMVRRIIRQDGWLRLYRGIVPTVCGSFPAQSMYYVAYEAGHYKLEQAAFKWTNGAPLSPFQDFLCHSFAGLSAECASACFYLPADMVSQRLQTQPRFSFFHAAFDYRGARDVVRTIYATQGIRGFYCGLVPHLLAYAPSGFVYWGVYELTKKQIPKRVAGVDSTLINAVSASIAGGAAVVVSNPFDVLRTRVQTYQTTSATTPSIAQLARYVWRHEGWTGFAKGMRPRLFVAIPGSMVALTGYEAIKSWSREGKEDGE
ncbi:hypothetical protein H9P43_004463 [Blastocladiella emersonii ATCC 22665]|nr:hypothetical protein H9P43_004463 [Blastocladiella emersonii ATCC 22665]